MKTEVSKNVLGKHFSGLQKVQADFQLKVDESIKEIEKTKESKDAEINGVKKKLVPLYSKVKVQKDLKNLEDLRKKEEEKLTRIRILKDNISKTRSRMNERLEELLGHYEEIFDAYKKLQAEFKGFEKDLRDISLNVNVKFHSDSFLSRMNSRLNVRDFKSVTKITDEYQFQQENHVELIRKLVDAVANEKAKTKSNSTPKDAITSVLQDDFYLDFQLTYKRDAFIRMSPGKKGLILLRLLIELSDREWPILLDQPEDDLDNRSVYSDLVAFIREKKSERQIILVTHNPNLVVGGDAEEVIVASQEGQEEGRENKEYIFEYVSGALENSFHKPDKQGALYKMGIREHVCDVLEGGKEAFLKRERRYSF
jgi:predicted ATPase